MTDLSGQRSYVTFHFKLGKKGTETHQMLKQAFGSEVMCQAETYKWFNHFKSHKTSDEDKHSECLSISSPTLMLPKFMKIVVVVHDSICQAVIWNLPT